MPVSVRFLKAHHGDSILITVETEEKNLRILVDGGPAFTFKPRVMGDPRDGELKKVLADLKKNYQKIDLVIMTHVDEDHIGGIIKAFESKDALSELAKLVVFNSGRLIHEYFNETADPENDIHGNFTQAQTTSIAQGNTLERLLTDKGIWRQSIVKQGDIIDFESCKLFFLSPNEKELKRLLGQWVKEQKAPFTSAENTDWSQSYEDLLASDTFTEDDSKTNGSSLSFLLTVGGLNFLFLGDAFPTTVVEGLKELGFSPDNPLNASLVKVSHHGSKGNTNAEMLASIECSKYVISTDSSRHGLPNKVTLARIHNASPNAEVLFNYKSAFMNLYSNKEREELGVKIQVLSGELKFA